MAGKIRVVRSQRLATIMIGNVPFATVEAEWFSLHHALSETRRAHPECEYADKFLEWYYQMSLRGAADSPGGMEYRHRKQAWRRAGKPPVRPFLGPCVY